MTELSQPAVSVSDRFTIAVRGNGRRWSTGKPLAIWRVFAELDLASKTDVEMFLRRYGDPLGLPGAPESLVPQWNELHTMLRNAARGWEPEDQDGISRLTRDASRLQRARFFLAEDERLPGQGAKVSFYDVGLEPDRKTGAPVRRARTLSAFMLVSAAEMLNAGSRPGAWPAGAPMRRCAYPECRHWTDASHGLTRYCSNACRLAAHRRKGA